MPKPEKESGEAGDGGAGGNFFLFEVPEAGFIALRLRPRAVLQDWVKIEPSKSCSVFPFRERPILHLMGL